MDFFAIGIFLILGYLLQCFFTTFQLKDFSKTYRELNKQGKVAIGKVSGAVNSGAIVMFAVGCDGVIINGAYMIGVTIFARFKYFTDFNSKNVANLNEEDVKHLTKSLRRAILDSTKNYNIVASGGEIPEKLSLLQKISKKNEK